MGGGEKENKNEDKPVFGVSGRRIIYNKDGKPYVYVGHCADIEDSTNLNSCRTCNTLSDFQFVSGGVSLTAVKPAKKEPSESEQGPPDVEQLGRSSWTLLHSIAATYPKNPSKEEQHKLAQFIDLFGNFYPCWYCAQDFVDYTKKLVPQVDSQEAFGKWLCDSHNAVNEKLGKPTFDCGLWKQRWKDGWNDSTSK